MVINMKGSDFIFDHVDSFYYDCKEASLNRGRTSAKSPKHAITIALHHKKMKIIQRERINSRLSHFAETSLGRN